MNYEKHRNIKNRITSLPNRISDMDFEELYEDISTNWQEKSLRLRARRMRKLKKQIA
jgi:hypothetical protein